MLQSSNQYLRPDYLAAQTAVSIIDHGNYSTQSPLDTKSSPLALLAQTCSAIGADTTNPKLLAANIEKSTKSSKTSGADGGNGRDKSSPVSSHSSSVSTGSVEQQQIKSSFKPYEPNNNMAVMASRERLEADVERATNLSGCNSNSNNNSNNSSQSNHRVKTPKSSNGGQSHQPQNGQLTPSSMHHAAMAAATAGQRCDSNQSATSQRDSPAMANGLRRTPSTSAIDLQQRTNASPHHHHQQQQQRVLSSKESPAASASSMLVGGGSSTPTAQASPQASAASRLQAASDAAYAAAAKEANYVKALHAAAAAAASGMQQHTPTTSAGGMPSGASAPSYYPGYPSGAGGGMPYPMDLMTASALMSPHHPMFKSAALNPYLNYARLKGLDAASMMVPNICRDPYCTGCPSSPHYLNKAAGQPCPAGCPQCEGGAGSASNNGGAKGQQGGGGGGGGSSSAAAAAAVSSYHAQLAALAAASQMPYVCSWIGGDTAYCGKRFSTSDELFQHLRTHTASMPDSVLSAAAAGGIPPNHPLFQRTYPTPPLSPLSAARYHPYGKPSMLPPTLGPPGSLAGMPMPPHPALAQYFSPYALYGGPRMGSSHP